MASKRRFDYDDDDDDFKTSLAYIECQRQIDKYVAMKDRNNIKLKIRVYQGSIADCGGHQLIPFHRACSILDLSMVSIEYLTISDVKKRKWKPKDIIDWLIDSDVHFVLTHIHQGLDQLNWNMSELYNNEVDQRLLKHKGFPETLCPIWIQAKFDYILALLDEDMVNKTLKVDIRNKLNLAKIREDLKVLHPHLEVNTNYVAKTPFSTNRANFKFAKNEDELLGNKNMNTSKFQVSRMVVLILYYNFR
jgi:hypothetical protein